MSKGKIPSYDEYSENRKNLLTNYQDKLKKLKKNSTDGKKRSLYVGAIVYLQLREDCNVFELSNDLIYNRSRYYGRNNKRDEGVDDWIEILDDIRGTLLHIKSEKTKNDDECVTLLSNIAKYGRKNVKKLVRDQYIFEQYYYNKYKIINTK